MMQNEVSRKGAKGQTCLSADRGAKRKARFLDSFEALREYRPIFTPKHYLNNYYLF